MKFWRALALAEAALALGALGWAFAHRLAYPYDLEWMEGGMLCHALRLVEHRPIYAPPSLEFIPFLYTPLYPILLWALAPLVGVGYVVGRLISLVSLVAAWLCGYVFARREGGSRATALAAMALPAAAFVPTGAWLDLARPDTLQLGLVTVALCLGWWRRRSHLGVAIAAALLVAAFFVKQTASPFMIALGLALLVAQRRVVPTYVATLALVGLPILWWANHATDGWFWIYISKLHRQHEFYAARAFFGSPVRIVLLIGPALLLCPWALARRWSPGLAYAVWMGATGIGVACVGFGTQWAFTNAFVPGVFFPAIAIGTAAGRLISVEKRESMPRLRPTAVYVLLALTLALAPGVLLRPSARLWPRDWAIAADAPTGYHLGPYVPTAAERAAGDALLERLRAAPGDVLIPFHPFYAHLVGKRTFLHRMGVWDIARAGLGPPRGLGEAIATQRFSLVVMDYKIDGNWQQWPGLLARYQIAERVAGPRTFSGADTAPRYLLQPVIDKELQ
jgi:hypothetical protein